jgi:hypothetical protein
VHSKGKPLGYRGGLTVHIRQVKQRQDVPAGDVCLWTLLLRRAPLHDVAPRGGPKCARVIDHYGLRCLDATFRPRQLRVIKTKLFTGTTYDAHIEGLTRATKRHLGLSTVAMDGHYDMTFVPLFVLMAIETASLLRKPFPKCGALHDHAPVDICA